MRVFVFALALGASAQSIPDAGPWTLTGDPAAAMVAGMEKYLDRLRVELKPVRKPSAEKLLTILGVVDQRVPIQAVEDGPGVAARWPVLERVSAEGVHLPPQGTRRGCVVAVPDVDQPPEQLSDAREFAAAGYEVLSPVLLSTGSKYSGNPELRMSKLTHREWIYRMAFPVGRHPIGYEVQKVLAAVDWFAAAKCETSVYGKGDGGVIALFAAVLDPRIAAVEADGAVIEPKSLRDERVYRNLFGILRDFGDAEIRQMLGARVRRLPRADALPRQEPVIDTDRRMERQVRETEDHVQRLVGASRANRDRLWSEVRDTTPEEWRRNAEPLAQRFLHEVLGVLPEQRVPLNLRARKSWDEPLWNGWEIQFDVRPEFFGYGVLLVPKDLKPGEKRPLMVMQHGLQGRPQVFFGQKQGRDLEIYRNFGAQFADLGYVVYLPQNPYTGDFRHLVKMANPLGFSFYSLMRPQYAVMLDWLETLPFVDRERIGFYGLSYGGKTALRIPPFDPRYKAVVCAGDFNEWIVKLTTPDEPWSYVYTQEYELVEWDMAHVANHAELAMLVAPRPFLVERGHRDGVGIDEWVSYEYARVRRHYDELGIGDRTGIAFFNGPHRVDGPAASAFLRKYLGR
jgi:dienelactone hydrolase